MTVGLWRDRKPASTWATDQRRRQVAAAQQQPAPPPVPSKPRRDRPRPSAPRVGRRGALVVAAGLMLVLVVCVVVGVSVATGGSGEDRAAATPAESAAPATSPQQMSATPSGKTVIDCMEERGPRRTVSSGKGGTDSAEAVIVAYQYAFFVQRDPQAMVALTGKGPSTSSAETLSRGLGSVPVGTSWCVTIDPRGGDVFATTIRFIGDSGRTVTWQQDMTVPKRGQRWVITEVFAR